MKQVVYIASPQSKVIEIWHLNAQGELNFIKVIDTDGEVQPMVISKNKNLLYAGIRPNNRIITYHIEKNGYLKKKNENIILGMPNYLSLDLYNKFLFCGFYHSNCISIYALNNNGVPENLIQTIHNINGCHAIKINHKYKIALSTALKDDAIYLYYLNNTAGILTNTHQNVIYTAKKSGPRHFSIHPNQNYIYTINELKNTIDVWKIYTKNEEVILKNVQNVLFSILPKPQSYWGSDIHITACGRFIYASDRFSNTIGLFQINSNNNYLKFIKTYFTEEQPRSFCIDQTGKYLLVIGQKSNKLTIYYISYDTGELIRLNTYDTCKGPLWILTYQLLIK